MSTTIWRNIVSTAATSTLARYNKDLVPGTTNIVASGRGLDLWDQNVSVSDAYTIRSATIEQLHLLLQPEQRDGFLSGNAAVQTSTALRA